MKKRALAIALVMMLVLLTTPGAVSAEAGVINTGALGLNPSASGSIIAFYTDEYSIYQDLNGDGDTGDIVIRYYDTATGIVTNTGAVGGYPSASGSIIAFYTREGWISQDLNGDEDMWDFVVRYYDTATGTVTNTGVVGGRPSASGSIIAFYTDEFYFGQDLNGDGDKWDLVVRYYDTAMGTVTNTGAVGNYFTGAVDYPSASGSIIAFLTYESGIGQDLNGDGDTGDWVVRYYDTATGAVISTGAVGFNPSASGSIIAFYTYERWIGQDLNGDGDTSDSVIRYYDTATGTVTNTGAVGFNPSASGSIIAFLTNESGIGQDLNGDGDMWDHVVRYYDTATGTVTNTGAPGYNPSAGGSIIAFYTAEPWVDQDLNGDGDNGDIVIRYFTISEAGTIGSIQALIDAYLADGSIDNQGVVQALRAFLEQAQASIDRGNNKAAINTLEAFIKAVQAQAGKHISAPAAQTLSDAAQAVIDGLQ